MEVWLRTKEGTFGLNFIFLSGYPFIIQVLNHSLFTPFQNQPRNRELSDREQMDSELIRKSISLFIVRTAMNFEIYLIQTTIYQEIS